ncbi:hypothetical protein ACTFIU_001826 [Dictyostelium citrinum]
MYSLSLIQPLVIKQSCKPAQELEESIDGLANLVQCSFRETIGCLRYCIDVTEDLPLGAIAVLLNGQTLQVKATIATKQVSNASTSFLHVTKHANQESEFRLDTTNLLKAHI